MNGDGKRTLAVKSLARAAGFAAVGIAPATEVPHGDRLGRWLEMSWHGGMSFMAANLAKRLRPELLMDGARGVICLAAGAAPAIDAGEESIARFARGRDYHKVLKKRCHALMDRLKEWDARFAGRAFVDSGPIMERSLGAWAGLGWIGRNGCLFVEGLGSHALLCEIVCNLPLCPDGPVASGCDGCGACVKACPTGALGADGMVDARKCISYLTIEHRGAIDPALWPRMGCRVFGCDACQDACPHNKALAAGDAELIEPSWGIPGRTRCPPRRAPYQLADILAWRPEDWDLATRGSTCRRATHEMFVRNAVIAAGNSKYPSLLRLLEEVADRWPGLEGPARWAVERIRDTVDPNASL